MRRVAPAPSDEQLAAAEQTDNIRRREREAANADQQEDERLALAGDPDATERVQNRAAIAASASVLDSRPIQPEEEKNDAISEGGDRTVKTTRQRRRTNKTRDGVKVGDARRRDQDSAQPQTPLEEEEPDETHTKDEKLAYRLMDTAYKKWAKGAEKDLHKANRALAIDLGKDTALYLRSGIIRMADIHATIEKLTASARTGKDTTDVEEDFDNEMEDFRKQLRGEK